MTSCKKESDHTEFHLYIDRKRTGIHTKIGHGETEIHEYLIRSMVRELGLNKEQFLGWWIVASMVTNAYQYSRKTEIFPIPDGFRTDVEGFHDPDTPSGGM